MDEIPKEVHVVYNGDAVEAIVNEIYADLMSRHGDIEYLRDRAILTPLNEYVDVVNKEVLRKLPGEAKSYKSCDTISYFSIMGNKIGETTYIPRITMSLADKTLPFLLKRKQFPVSVCYAMTINKSQGQTVKNVGLYLPKPVFSHGQLYVAVSRVTSLLGLKIVTVDEDEVHAGYTKNIVYREIFSDIM